MRSDLLVRANVRTRHKEHASATFYAQLRALRGILMNGTKSKKRQSSQSR